MKHLLGEKVRRREESLFPLIEHVEAQPVVCHFFGPLLTNANVT